jgi:hypothetical protein
MPFRRREQVPGAVPSGGNALDLARFHASVRAPDSGEVHVIWQAYCYGPSAATAAQGLIKRLRHGIPGQLEPSSWALETYQVVTCENRAYWWNSGSVTEELLLTDRVPHPGEFAAVWETYIRAPSFDDAVRAAGEQLLDSAIPARLAVTDSSGRTEAMTIGA